MSPLTPTFIIFYLALHLRYCEPQPVRANFLPSWFSSVTSTKPPPTDSNLTVTIAHHPLIAPIRLPTRPYCGRALKANDDKIVGGAEDSITRTPWIVSLRYNNRHYCAGTIIAPHIILTAGHCLFLDSSEISVLAGSSTLKPTLDSMILQPTRAYTHPQYNQHTIQNDIGLLFFPETINFGQEVPILPACLPANYSQSKGIALVSGFGRTSEHSSSSQHLRSVHVPLIDDDECRQAYGHKVVDSMLCAGYDEGGKDACQGDSGGPLTLDGEIIGIVSWGIGCARPHKPGVYTQVSYFINWIHETMAKIEEDIRSTTAHHGRLIKPEQVK